jgi:hypothetical protein
VVETIRNQLLRAGYPRQEIEDGIGEVNVKIQAFLVRDGILVETVEQMCAIVRDPARWEAIDEVRAQAGQRRTNAGATDQEDTFAARQPSAEQVIYQRELVSAVQRNATPDEVPFLQARAEGRTHEQTAAALGIPAHQARKASARMVKRLKGVLVKHGLTLGVAGALALAASVLILSRTLDRGGVAAPNPGLPPSSSVPPPPPPAHDLEHAAALRAKAHEAALQHEWRICLDVYTESDVYDAHGRTAEQTTEARRCNEEVMKTIQR